MTTLTSHAATAKAIRATLKATWPTVRFSVRAESFAGGNSVDISWTDGPTTREVETLTDQHQYGHFDGMIDLYEYSNTRDDIPQVKFVQTRRTMSDEARRAVVAYLNDHWGYALRLVTRTHGDRTWEEIDPTSNAPRGNGSGWQADDMYRDFWALSLLCRDCGAGTLPGDGYCHQCGHPLQWMHDDTA